MSKIDNYLMDAIVSYMDDEKRERVHFESAPCSNEKFLKEYLKLDTDFSNVLKSEFSLEL